MKKQSIESLKYAFTISVALFDFMEIVQNAGNSWASVKQQKMKILHKLALEKLSEKNPRIKQIKNLLKEMEDLTKET